MKSHEVLRDATEQVGVKSLAKHLRLSAALVYKWCEEPVPGEDTAGARNPLDRVHEIMVHTGSAEPVRWLCRQAGGFFVPNPPVRVKPVDTELLMDTQKLVQEFSQLLLTVTRSLEDDGQIRAQEAERIRRAWDRLKSTAEEFVVAGERGLYRDEK